jgi:hypothetical protein
MSVFELKNCIKGNDGNIYCWDCGIKDWVRWEMRPIHGASNLPPDVIEKLAAQVVGENSGNAA